MLLKWNFNENIPQNWTIQHYLGQLSVVQNNRTFRGIFNLKYFPISSRNVRKIRVNKIWGPLDPRCHLRVIITMYDRLQRKWVSKKRSFLILQHTENWVNMWQNSRKSWHCLCDEWSCTVVQQNRARLPPAKSGCSLLLGLPRGTMKHCSVPGFAWKQLTVHQRRLG